MKTPLWTAAELGTAFALLLPEAEARALAAEWFADFAGEADRIDVEGRYLYPGSWGGPHPPTPGDDEEDAPEWHTSEQVRKDQTLFAGWSDAETVTWLGPRLADIHLSLAALVSDELYERMRIVRFMSRRQAARNRLQLTRAVRAHREARGWPPAV
jgi:hypothetical protein